MALRLLQAVPSKEDDLPLLKNNTEPKRSISDRVLSSPVVDKMFNLSDTPPARLAGSFLSGSTGLLDLAADTFKSMGRTPPDYATLTRQGTPAPYYSSPEFNKQQTEARVMAEALKSVSQESKDVLTPKDPKFSDQLAQGLGSSVSLAPLAAGGAGIARLLSLSPKAATIMASLLSAGGESQLESIQAGERAEQKGMAPNEVQSAKDKAFALNFPVIAATNVPGFIGRIFGKGIGKEVREGAVKAGAKSILPEAAQEAYQSAVGDVSVGDKIDPKNMAKSAAIGGIVGGGMGAVAGAQDKRATQAELMRIEKVLSQSAKSLTPLNDSGEVGPKNEPKDYTNLSDVKKYYHSEIVGKHKDVLGRDVEFKPENFNHLIKYSEGDKFSTKRAKTLPLIKKLIQDPDEIRGAEHFSEKHKKGEVYLREFYLPESKTKILLATEFDGKSFSPVTSFESPTIKQLDNIKKGRLIYARSAGLTSQPSSEIPARVIEDSKTGNLPQQDIRQGGISKPTVENIQQPENIVKDMLGVLPASKVSPTIKEATGIIKEKTPIKSTEEALLKRELGQEQKASREGYRAGRKEAISEMKNFYSNKSELIKRQSELKRLEDDMRARDREVANIATIKAKNEYKLEKQKREFEIQRLKEDIKSRDVQRGKERVKKFVINYVKDNLPLESRGKYIGQINNSETPGDVIGAFRRVDKEVDNIERKSTIEKIRKESTKALESGKVAVEYKKSIEEILGGIELSKRRPETLDRIRETQKFVDHQRESGKDVEMPERILKQLRILVRKPAGEISNAELKNILSDIEIQTKLGETKQRSREAIYNLQKEKREKELLEGTLAIEKNPLIMAEPGEKLSITEKFKNIFPVINNQLQHLDLAITPMDTFFDLLDGGNADFNGSNYRIFKKTTDTNYQSYLRLANKHSNEAEAMARDLKLDDSNFERIGIHAARMQKDGFQKLLDSDLTEEQINKVELTEREMKFYKMMRRVFDELRPQVEDVMKNVYNKPLGEVENYVSFMTDFEKMSESEIFSRFGDDAPQIKSPTKTLEMGFTKQRKGGKQPIKLNAYDIFVKHVDNVAYLVNMARDNKMLFEIANSQKYGEVAGDLGQRYVKEWLDLVSRKGGVGGEQRIKVLDILRRNFGIARLGLNVTSALIQPTALLDGASIIGNYAFDGALQTITSQKKRKFVIENMPELKERVADDPAYMDFGDNKWFTKFQKFGYFFLKSFDAVTATGVAYGAYMKKMNELKIPIDLNKPNKEAIDYAQEIVRRTQSSGIFKDSPLAISKGKFTGNVSFDKALFQFQSFMLTRWNNIRNYIWRANIQGGRTYDPKSRNFRAAFTATFFLILAVLMETEARRRIKEGTDKLTGNNPKNKETFGEDFLKNLVTTIPFVSQAVSVAVYKSDFIPSFGGVRDLLEFPRIITAKKPETKIKSSIDFLLGGVGGVSGVPGTSQLAKILKSRVDAISQEKKIKSRTLRGIKRFNPESLRERIEKRKEKLRLLREQ